MKFITLIMLLFSLQTMTAFGNGQCSSADWNKLSFYGKKLTSEMDSDGEQNNHKNTFELNCYQSWPVSKAQVEHLLGSLLGVTTNYSSKKTKKNHIFSMFKDISIIKFVIRQNNWKSFETTLSNMLTKFSPGYWFVDLDSGETIMFYNTKTKENYIITTYEK